MLLLESNAGFDALYKMLAAAADGGGGANATADRAQVFRGPGLRLLLRPASAHLPPPSYRVLATSSIDANSSRYDSGLPPCTL